MTEPRRLTRTVVIALGLLAIALPALAAVPSTMNYQGRLTDNSPQQNPVTAVIPIDFSIWSSSVGGGQLWAESWGGVSVNDGIFSVLLGSNGSPIPSSVFTGGTSRYLEIVVNGETLSPRQQLGSTGWAHQAELSSDVDCVGCVDTADVLNGSITGLDVAPNSLTSGELATGSVGTAELAADAVTGAKIAPDTVLGVDIAPNAVGNSELDNSSEFTFNGGVILDSGSKELVSREGGVDKLEWWADPVQSYLYNRPSGTYLLVNDATGNWGINTSSPASTLDVNGTLRANGLSVDGGAAFTGQIEENGCADGNVEQRFPGLSDSSANRQMVGCAAAVTFDNRAEVCDDGWHVCDDAEWRNNSGATTPVHDYWVDDQLYYNGTAASCWVTLSPGNSCSGSSMKVCAPGGSCTWKNCSYSGESYNYYYGGCGPSTAGALCCKGEPQARVWQFLDTSSNNVSDTWLDAAWTNVSAGTSWYLFIERKINAQLPVQYCLKDAKWYIDTYLLITPGSATISDGGREKWYRTSPADAWTGDNTPRTNYFGASCAAGSYDWCVAWGLGGELVALRPEVTGWGEINGASSGPSTLRIRVSASRESACGF